MNVGPVHLPSAGPLNLPLGVLPKMVGAPAVGFSHPGQNERQVSAVEPNALEQLADLRIEIVALRNLIEVGLDLLASDVPPADIARFLTSTGCFKPDYGCACALHRTAA